MTQRTLSTLSTIGLAVAGLLLTLLLLLVWLLGTQTGSRLLWSGVTGAVDGLTAESVVGRIGGPLSLQGLRYETDNLRLTIGSFQLDWAPARLLSADLRVTSLHVDDVVYTQLRPAPAAQDSEPFGLPEELSLPVGIELRDLVLRSLEYRATPDAEAFHVDELTLDADFRGTDLSINQLSAHGPLFRVQAGARARTQGDYVSTASIDWQAALPDLAPLAGKITVDGGLSTLRIEQTIEAPYRSVQEIEILDLLGDLRLDAHIELVGIEVQKIDDKLPAVAVSGTLETAGILSDLSFTADIDADSAEFGTLDLLASGGFSDQILALERLLLSREPGGATLEATARASLADAAPSFSVRGDWRALSWPLVGAPRMASDTGQFTIDGSTEDYAVGLDAALAVPGQAGGQLTLAGRGGRDAFELADLRLALLDGFLQGSGEVRWSPEVQGSVTLDGEGLNPAVLAPDFPGNLRMTLRADGGITNGAVDAKVDTLTLAGVFRDKPLDIQLSGGLQDTELRLSTLAIAAGETRVSVRGNLDLARGDDERLGQNRSPNNNPNSSPNSDQGAGVDLQWDIDSPDLGDLLPAAKGSLAGAGTLGGSLPLPAVSGSLRGETISYADYQLESLSLELDVDLAREDPSQLELTLEELLLAGVEISQLGLSGTGKRGDHRLAMQVTSPDGSAQLSLAGDLQDSRWQGELVNGALQYGTLAAWNLDKPQPLTVAAREQQLEQGCWTSGESQLCLQAQRTDNDLDAAVTLSEFGLDYLRPLLGDALSLNGALNARANIRQKTGSVPEIEAVVTGDGVELRTGEVTEQPNELLLGLQSSQISMNYGEAGLRADVSIPWANGGGIDGIVQVAQGSEPVGERPLSGKITLALDDIGFLTTLSSEIENAAGALSGDFDLSGTLLSPMPSGELRLVKGSLGLAAPGLDISDIGVVISSSGGTKLDFDGQATSGEGGLSLTGSAVIDGAQTVADIAIQGDSFEVVNTPDARVSVSPELQVALRETGINVSGQVVVPRAEITPQKLPESVVSASSDQVIITGDSAGDDIAASTQNDLSANIRVVLGDAVSVDGFGLKARLTGALAVTQSPGQPTLGSGEINIVDGEYRAYGQGLVIDTGKILFAGGPIAEPGLSLRALRRPAEGIVVGVSVRGPLEAPDFSIFSEPGMTQSEQLSWLVLGRPLNGASEGESSLIAQAALALGLRGGNLLADRFGGNLGVDSVGIETGSGEAGAASDANQAALVIGKYLSPDLFVSYGIGLFDSISTIRLEYSVTDHWKVSTESSTLSSGGDITYTRER